MNYQNNSTANTGCTPCQQNAMRNMTDAQKLVFLRQLGLTTELQALEAKLRDASYSLPTPNAI